MKNTRNILVFLLLGVAAPGTAQITVDAIPTGILCANVQMELPYTASGTYNAGNTFTVELSDVNGSFATPTVLGSVVSTASGTITCTFPAGLSGNGFQLRVNSSDPLEMGVPTAGMLMEAPNAGVNSVASICGNSIQALPFLNGSPDMGGTWSIHMGIGVWMFDDQFTGMADGAVLRYVVTSPNGCADTALVFVNTTIPPVAGANTSITVCASDAPFSMYQELGGFPDAGGTWTNPGGDPQPPVFTPGVSMSGCYTYTVVGSLPCANDTSSLCISVNDVSVLGPNFSITLCTPTPLDMGAGLPPGGTWAYLGAPHSNMFIPGVDPIGPYVYTIPGIPPCPAVSLTAMMNVDAPANAGVDATLNWCQSSGALDLFAQLVGTPSPGGTWTDDNATGALSGSTFNPVGVPSGTYVFTYTVGGGACPAASASVTVNHSGVCLVPPQYPYPVE